MGPQENNTSQRILKELACPVESIVNLLYLIEHERDDPAAVLRYVRMADTPARCLIEATKYHSNI